MKWRWLQTSLIRTGMEALEIGVRRGKNVLLHGPPGIGKSTLIQHALRRRGLWAGRRVRVVSIRLFSHQTLRHVLFALCCALKGETANPRERVTQTQTELFYYLLDLLDEDNADVVLVIADEFDYAVGTSISDVLRDVFDEAGGRLIFAFVSIGGFAAKMANPTTPLLEAAASRLAVHRRLPNASQADAQLLADHLLEGVRFETDLVAHLLKSARGSVRSLLDSYEAVEEAARIAGVERLSLAKWTELRRLAVGAVEEAPASGAAISQSIGQSATQPSRPNTHSGASNSKRAVAKCHAIATK